MSGDGMSTIHVHIERLVLEGLPLTPGAASRLQVALERELERRLAASPATDGHWASGAAASVSAATVAFAPGAPAAVWGQQLGSAIAETLQPPACSADSFPRVG